MQRYHNDLTRGHVSREIFPTTFKRLKKADVIKKGGTWQACAQCGEEFGLFDKVDGPPFCQGCQNQETEARCFLCDRHFTIRLSQAHRQDGREPMCHECRVQSRTQQCRDCGQLFEVTASNRAFFKRKGLSLPQRCVSCRRQKRAVAAPVVPAPVPPSAFGEWLREMLARWFKF
jgi:hypothetical protein